MSVSDGIDFDTEYRFYDGKTKLAAEELNNRFQSLHQRLVSVEVKGQGYDDMIAQGTAAALKRINDGVSPILTTLLAQLDAAQQALDTLDAEVESGIYADQLHLRVIPGMTSANVQDAVVELKADIANGDAAVSANAGSIHARDLYLTGF